MILQLIDMFENDSEDIANEIGHIFANMMIMKDK